MGVLARYFLGEGVDTTLALSIRSCFCFLGSLLNISNTAIAESITFSNLLLLSSSGSEDAGGVEGSGAGGSSVGGSSA